jgi:tetratricopeptide (TPR) repeat protein
MGHLAHLAVAPGELDLASVLALSGLDEPAAFALLDTLLEAGVLRVSGTRYRFEHELVRRALLDDLPPHRRLALHRDAARRLERVGAAPELVARHWLEGERPAAAVPWLLTAAARAAGLGAFADALGHVERLLGADPGHHGALVLRAETLDALGDPRAPAAYAAAAAARGEPEAQELRARQALAQIKASDPGGALRTLEGVRPRTPGGLLAQALTLSAAAAIGWYADAETAAVKAGEAYELAVRLDDPGAILDATWAQALASHARGELPARLRRYLRTTHELPELATRVFDGQLCVTERMLFGGLPNDEIIAFADALAAEAERLGAVRGHAFALTLRGEAEHLAGRLAEADRDFAEGARLHGQIGAAAGEALSLLGRAQVATSLGRPELAGPVARRRAAHGPRVGGRPPHARPDLRGHGRRRGRARPGRRGRPPGRGRDRRARRDVPDLPDRLRGARRHRRRARRRPGARAALRRRRRDGRRGHRAAAGVGRRSSRGPGLGCARVGGARRRPHALSRGGRRVRVVGPAPRRRALRGARRGLRPRRGRERPGNAGPGQWRRPGPTGSDRGADRGPHVRSTMIAVSREDAAVAIEGGGAEMRTKDLGQYTVAFARFAQGVDLGPALAGLPDDLCPCPHWGYMIKGRVLMRTPDGDRVYEAGQAFYWGPGHAPVALEDCEYVDFSPTEAFTHVLDHVRAAAS